MKLPRRHKRELGLGVSAPDRWRQTPNKKHAQRTQTADQSSAPLQLSAAEVETRQVRNDPDILRSAALATDTPNQLLWNSLRILETTGSEITRLMNVSGEDRRPETRAHVLAHRMIVSLTDLRFALPASDVYSDPDKAIRLLWNRNDRTVELVFPSSETEAPYLYRSDEQEYHIEENPSAQSAKEWLGWVFGDGSAGVVPAT